jgi:NAD-dependent SIR2 family protein deacetylase
LISGLKANKFKKILMLTGAGISVSAGIPDFRSPKTGLYATLKGKYDMDYPEQIFSIDYFLERPEVFYDFSKGSEWTKYNPTPTHYFIKLLHDKGLLWMNLTQNIDCLELKAGIPEDKVIAAHGDLRAAECAKCKKRYTKA